MEWIDRVEFSPDGEVLVFGFHTVGDRDKRLMTEIVQKVLSGLISKITQNCFERSQIK